jgi:hypothetical protein
MLPDKTIHATDLLYRLMFLFRNEVIAPLNMKTLIHFLTIEESYERLVRLYTSPIRPVALHSAVVSES